MSRGHKDACRDVDVCVLDAIHHKVGASQNYA